MDITYPSGLDILINANPIITQIHIHVVPSRGFVGLDHTRVSNVANALP